MTLEFALFLRLISAIQILTNNVIRLTFKNQTNTAILYMELAVVMVIF